VQLGVGQPERLVLAQRAEALSRVEGGYPEVGAKGVLDDLRVPALGACGAHLRGARDLGIEVDGDLALRGGYKKQRSVMTLSRFTVKPVSPP
jgi:hypothetical protein